MIKKCSKYIVYLNLQYFTTKMSKTHACFAQFSHSNNTDLPNAYLHNKQFFIFKASQYQNKII